MMRTPIESIELVLKFGCQAAVDLDTKILPKYGIMMPDHFAVDIGKGSKCSGRSAFAWEPAFGNVEPDVGPLNMRIVFQFELL